MEQIFLKCEFKLKIIWFSVNNVTHASRYHARNRKEIYKDIVYLQRMNGATRVNSYNRYYKVNYFSLYYVAILPGKIKKVA